MSALDFLNPVSLGSLAAEIDLLHDEAERHATTAVVYAARCGEKLIKAKAAVGHGQWLDWLAANCRVKERQARKYMTLANEMPELLEPNRHPSADLLGINHAIALLTADDEVKAEVQARLDAGETVSVRAIEQLKREAQAERETRQQLSAKLEQVQKQNQVLHDNLAAASEREQRSYRELIETQEEIARLAEERSREAIEQARQEAQAAEQRVEALRQQLQQAEKEQKVAIERGVNYNLAQRQAKLDQLERDIQYAENSLASFRQKLREISSAEYENQRLSIDAEKVLREIVLFGTTLNLYESEEIFPVNWQLLEQIIVGAESLAARVAQFRASHRLSEKPIPAEV